MSNFMRINDLVKLNLVDMVEVKDNFPVQAGGQPLQQGLLVRIAATHSGIINRNNMFYLPDKMAAGAKSFTENFQKPILLNHDEQSDPIGRIVAARYVDTSSYVKDKYRGKTLRDAIGRRDMPFDEKLLDSFVSGKMGYGAQVDFVRTYLSDSIMDDPGYEGLGFIQIDANITDKEAVSKFLDGRYLTGSVGAATDRATCSNCKQDWTKEGPCDHKPGKIYDGVKCHLIAGNFLYDEYSVANKPADKFSKVLELMFNGIKDSIKVEDTEFSGRLHEVRVQFPKEDDVMKVKDSQGNEVVPPVTPENKETPVVPPVVVDKTEESFDDFITRVLDFEKGDLSDADDEKLYSLMLDEMKESKLFEEKQIEDAKLSTEKRKSLSKSSFCGPNKSFPVPDCAHVTAARRLIGRYNGPGDKSTILACVSRKASAMGCGTADSAVVTPVVPETPSLVQAADKLEADQFKTVFAGLVELAKKKDASLVKDLLAATEKSLLDEVISLETKLGEFREANKKLEDSTKALKEEYQLAVKEAEVLQDAVVKTKAALRTSKMSTLSLYKSLKTGTIVDVTALAESFTDATIDTELETLGKEVDIKKITDKLNDGTSRNPKGTVENPGASESGNRLDAKQVRDRLASIQATYLELRFKNTVAAEKYLADQMALLRLEGNLPVESK